MNKTLAAIVIASALELSALVGGCDRKITDPQEVKQEFVVKIPKHDGELINVRRSEHNGRHYVVFKNADGSMTEYVQAGINGWNKWDYQK